MHECIDCQVHKRAVNCTQSCRDMFKNLTTVADVSGNNWNTSYLNANFSSASRGLANMKISSVLCQPLEPDENGCSFQYVPYYQGDDLWAMANDQKTCPEILNIAGKVLKVKHCSNLHYCSHSDSIRCSRQRCSSWATPHPHMEIGHDSSRQTGIWEIRKTASWHQVGQGNKAHFLLSIPS